MEVAGEGGSAATALVIDDDDEEDSSSVGNHGTVRLAKKARVVAVRSTLDSFVDWPMGKEEKEKTDLGLLRYVITSLTVQQWWSLHANNITRFLIHGNVAFNAVKNPFFTQWVDCLCPSYTIPSQFVLMMNYLPCEEARVHVQEVARLKKQESLTLMTDGWEDRLRRSIYGTLLVEVGFRPVVLGLEDLTGKRATAETVLTVVEGALQKKEVAAGQVIALVTDNPTTMTAFRRNYQLKYPWTIVSNLILRL